MAKKTYVEPDNYFPESIRKEFKIGDYAEDEKKKEENRELNKKFRDLVNNK